MDRARRRIASSNSKIAVLAPMPRARVRMAIVVKAGFLRRRRRAKRALLADGFFGFFVGAKGDTGLALGFRAREAGALEVVGVAGDVRTEFFVEVAVCVGAVEERGEQEAQICRQFDGSSHFSATKVNSRAQPEWLCYRGLFAAQGDRRIDLGGTSGWNVTGR